MLPKLGFADHFACGVGAGRCGGFGPVHSRMNGPTLSGGLRRAACHEST